MHPGELVAGTSLCSLFAAAKRKFTKEGLENSKKPMMKVGDEKKVEKAWRIINE